MYIMCNECILKNQNKKKKSWNNKRCDFRCFITLSNKKSYLLRYERFVLTDRKTGKVLWFKYLSWSSSYYSYWSPDSHSHYLSIILYLYISTICSIFIFVLKYVSLLKSFFLTLFLPLMSQQVQEICDLISNCEWKIVLLYVISKCKNTEIPI